MKIFFKLKKFVLFTLVFSCWTNLSFAEEKKDVNLTYFTVRVQRGDTLQRISMWAYQTTRRWKEIYQNNQDVIQNKDFISVGIVLKLKYRKKMTPEALAYAEKKHFQKQKVDPEVTVSKSTIVNKIASRKITSYLPKEKSEAKSVIKSETVSSPYRSLATSNKELTVSQVKSKAEKYPAIVNVASADFEKAEDFKMLNKEKKIESSFEDVKADESPYRKMEIP